MADSDNSTTLPFVIKRWRKRRGTVDAAQVSSCARSTTSPSIHVDPAFELWRRWQETHHAARVLCRLQQRQESRLLKLDARNRSGAEDLQTMNSQHEAARCAEIDAMDAEEQLLTACAATAATSLVGVLAKLEIIKSGGQGRAAPSEFPWPQIRSTVNDLRTILKENQGTAISA